MFRLDSRRGLYLGQNARQSGARGPMSVSNCLSDARSWPAGLSQHCASFRAARDPAAPSASLRGELAERSKAHAWKACVGQPTVGSNPTLSAIQSAVAETVSCAESESAGFGRIRGVWGGSGFGSPPETERLRGRWGALGRKFSVASFGGGLSGIHSRAARAALAIGAGSVAWGSALERTVRLQQRRLL